MRPRERIEAVLEGRGVDQVPLYPPYQGYWALALYGMDVPTSLRDPEAGAEVQMKAAERFGFDGIEASGDCFMPYVEALGATVDQPDVGPGSTQAPIVLETADLDRLEMPDIGEDVRTQANLRAARHLVDRVGRERFIHMSVIAPLTLAGELRGVEALMLDTILEPDFVRDLLRFCTDDLCMYMEELTKTGVDAISVCDPTASGSLISKDDFEHLVLPHIIEQDRAVRKGGAIDILHICGDTSDRLDIIRSSGAEVFSMDWQVNIKDAFEKVGQGMVLLGNVRPPHTLFAGTPEACLEEALACIDDAASGRFILGAGCDIPPGSPEENVMQLRKAVEMRRSALRS
ncbi:MAG TPA: uroporphyrinogen decarboxylase family protein [Methanomassiliicoccaceae archaeon]|mgnify:CR=1 FL=1|jgi:MtaA/CmuA family methyltransferase|nr:uroporphyrinogen decarboxylase family protein [Methanomassiliicoccaceae archaeon]HQD87438.1 uroporphyrinogen decarboxylase family protein [Methanomassiliicoccaceae archaeon]